MRRAFGSAASASVWSDAEAAENRARRLWLCKKGFGGQARSSSHHQLLVGRFEHEGSSSAWGRRLQSVLLLESVSCGGLKNRLAQWLAGRVGARCLQFGRAGPCRTDSAAVRSSGRAGCDRVQDRGASELLGRLCVPRDLAIRSAAREQDPGAEREEASAGSVRVDRALRS